MSTHLNAIHYQDEKETHFRLIWNKQQKWLVKYALKQLFWIELLYINAFWEWIVHLFIFIEFSHVFIINMKLNMTKIKWSFFIVAYYSTVFQSAM